MCDVGAAGWPGVLAVLRRRHVYGGVLLTMHKTWIIPQQRYVTVVFESQEDVDRWESLFKALVELNASEDAIGTLCAEVYGGPAWLYHPPSGMIELYVPHVITEFSDCMRQYDWWLYEGQQPVRRYDGTAQQAEEAMAAESI